MAQIRRRRGVKAGLQARDGQTDQQILAGYCLSTEELMRHTPQWPANKPAPEPIPLNKKLKRQVWAGKMLTAIKLPANPKWLQREGYEMQHCLQFLHEEYAGSVGRGDIDIYSLINGEGRALINIEVARKRGYGVPEEVSRPTIMQVRGFRNQCPPDDILMPDLMEFLDSYGREWVTAERFRNFDGKADAVLVRKRWDEIRAGRAGRRSTR